MSETVRLAAVCPVLDWSHRWLTSNERFDAAVARGYIERRVAHVLRLMDEAASMGADLVLAPEYMRGSEMFSSTLENRRALIEDADGETVGRMRELSRRRGVYLAGAMDMRHGDLEAQTGVLTGPGGDLVGVQVKNTAVGEDSPLARGYDLLETRLGRIGIFTCSDLTTWPEDAYAAARAGMQVLLVPGCGFAGVNWRSVLVVRAGDLSVATVYADGGQAAVVEPTGRVLAQSRTADGIVMARVEIAPREPVARLKSSLK